MSAQSAHPARSSIHSRTNTIGCADDFVTSSDRRRSSFMGARTPETSNPGSKSNSRRGSMASNKGRESVKASNQEQLEAINKVHQEQLDAINKVQQAQQARQFLSQAPTAARIDRRRSSVMGCESVAQLILQRRTGATGLRIGVDMAAVPERDKNRVHKRKDKEKASDDGASSASSSDESEKQASRGHTPPGETMRRRFSDYKRGASTLQNSTEASRVRDELAAQASVKTQITRRNSVAATMSMTSGDWRRASQSSSGPASRRTSISAPRFRTQSTVEFKLVSHEKVKQVASLKKCEPDFVEICLELLETRLVPEGEILLNEGDVSASLIVLVHGTVEALVDGEVIATFEEGCLLGQEVVLGSDIRSVATLRCKTFCDCRTIPKQGVNVALKNFAASKATLVDSAKAYISKIAPNYVHVNERSQSSASNGCRQSQLSSGRRASYAIPNHYHVVRRRSSVIGFETTFADGRRSSALTGTADLASFNLGANKQQQDQGLRRGSMALPSMPLDCDNDTTSLIHRRTSIMGCETFGDLSSLVEHALPELTETHGDEAEEDSDGSSASSNESWLSLEKSEKDEKSEKASDNGNDEEAQVLSEEATTLPPKVSADPAPALQKEDDLSNALAILGLASYCSGSSKPNEEEVGEALPAELPLYSSKGSNPMGSTIVGNNVGIESCVDFEASLPESDSMPIAPTSALPVDQNSSDRENVHESQTGNALVESPGQLAPSDDDPSPPTETKMEPQISSVSSPPGRQISNESGEALTEHLDRNELVSTLEHNLDPWLAGATMDEACPEPSLQIDELVVAAQDPAPYESETDKAWAEHTSQALRLDYTDPGTFSYSSEHLPNVLPEPSEQRAATAPALHPATSRSLPTVPSPSSNARPATEVSGQGVSNADQGRSEDNPLSLPSLASTMAFDPACQISRDSDERWLHGLAPHSSRSGRPQISAWMKASEPRSPPRDTSNGHAFARPRHLFSGMIIMAPQHFDQPKFNGPVRKPPSTRNNLGAGKTSARKPFPVDAIMAALPQEQRKST